MKSKLFETFIKCKTCGSTNVECYSGYFIKYTCKDCGIKESVEWLKED